MNVDMKACRVLLFIATLMVLGSWGAAQAYNAPSGPNDLKADISRPNSHGTIVLKAIDVLRSDGSRQMADYFSQYRQQLLDGTRRADRDGGDIHLGFKLDFLVKEFTLLSESIPANTMTHFYNPYTGRGLQLFRDAGAASSAISTANALSLGPWQLYTLLGPQPAATDMADWFYAKAVDEMRQGRVPEAMMNLGKSLHLVADLTVPQHAADRHGGYPGAMHAEYEAICDEVLGTIAHATSAKDLDNLYAHPGLYTPGWLGHQAAMQSTSLLGAATGSPAQMRSAAGMLIPQAEKLSAALLKRFWEEWESENFLVAVVRVDRVRALDGNIDNGSSPDFYANVKVYDKWYHTGTIVGASDMQPQALAPYSWFFPRWISDRPDSLHTQICVLDEDGGLNGGDDRVDITPVKGYALDFDYWPATRQVTGDVSRQAPDFTVDGNPDDNASISLHVEHAPTVTKVKELPAAVTGTVQTAGGKPARGSYVFFRDASGNAEKWQRVRVGDDGRFQIPSVRTRNYAFRPAGSTYDFNNVPRVVKLQPGTNAISFTAESKPLSLAVSADHVAALANAVLRPEKQLSAGDRVNNPGNVSNVLVTLGERQARALLEERALQVQLPSAELGVLGNGLGYAERGSVLVHVASIVNPENGQPLQDLKNVKVEQKTIPLPNGHEKTVELLQGANTGPGAADVEVRATLWLGNDAVGFHKAGEATNRTDLSGSARFSLRAGTHAEEAKVTVEVLSNPVNPWCKPKDEQQPLFLISPAGQGGDTGAQQPYSVQAAKFATITARNQVADALAIAGFGAQAAAKNNAQGAEQARDTLDWARFEEQVRARQQSDAVRVDPEKPAEPTRRPGSAGAGATPKPTRRPIQMRPARVSGAVVVEAESLTGTARVTGGTLDRQDMKAFGDQWNGGAQLFWQAPAPKDQPTRQWPSLTALVKEPKAGTYHAVLYFTQAPDYGDAILFVDGKRVGTLSGYADTVRLGRLDLGDLKVGEHGLSLVLTVNTKNAASTGYFIGLDRLELQPR